MGLELDILSAKRRHDEALAGRRSALHLFSDELPFRLQASSWLSAQKTASTAARIFDELSEWDIRAGEAWIRDLAYATVPVGAPVSGEVIADGLRLGTVNRADLQDNVKSANPNKVTPEENTNSNPDTKANPDNNTNSDTNLENSTSPATPSRLDRIACSLAAAYLSLGTAFKVPYFDLNG